MKVLLVNAYDESPSGKEACKVFREETSKIIEAVKKQNAIDKCELIQADKASLDEYIYDGANGENYFTALKKFERIDIILICGDPNTLPWGNPLAKIAKLFIQCKKMETPVFISGCGMGILAYYCATGYTPLNVINGCGKGGALSSIASIPVNQREVLKDKDVFLDNVTGDYYFYDKDKKEWVPKGNTGLHYSKSAEEYGSPGAYFKKPLIYHPRKDTLLYVNSAQEQIVNIKKIHLQHWALKELPTEFKVLAKNKWDPHPVNINVNNLNSVRNNYKVLAESKRGPQIAEHEKCLCVQFEVLPKYFSSVLILSNFIHKHVADIYTSNECRVESTTKIRTRSNTVVSLQPVNQTSFKTCNSNHQANGSSVMHSKVFVHSGLTYSKRKGILVLENNAASTKNLKLSYANIKVRPVSGKQSYPKTDVVKVQRCFTSHYCRQKSFSRFKSEESPATSQQYTSLQIKELAKHSQSFAYDSTPSKEIGDLFVPSILHPRIKKETSGIFQEAQKHRPKSGIRAKSVVSVETPFCRYKEFSRMPSYNRASPCIRLGSPYKSEEDIKNEEHKDSKKKWITKNGFMAHGGKHCTGYKLISNYVGKEPSEPPVLHRFRTVDKRKWISGSFKLL